MGRQVKVVRSYRLVFRRRWRIFRIQGWRIPLPGGLELRLLGYWLACLALSFALSALPLLGPLLRLAPSSLRLIALPLAAAWLLNRSELDGRPPHRALLGLLLWRLRARSLAGLRRTPPPGSELIPLGRLVLAPDLSSSRPPAGEITGPARILIRYPLRIERLRRPGRNHWRALPTAAPALHRGRTLEVPEGVRLSLESR